MKNIYQLLIALLGFSALTNAQVPVFSSLPTAAPTIFLDFDGHTVQGTSWNWNGPLVVGPANLTVSQMTEIYNRVAEDYRPFAVNVTTDSTRYWAAPANRRMRVLLTVTSQWYGNAGGVAYLGSFTWGDNTPCFVFTALLNYNAKNIAEAASHEVGHTLGLRHQSAYDAFCNKTSEYNVGAGTGEIGWAPIMGVGYYKNFTLWNNGANPLGCSNFQNDLEIITGSNGFTYRPDDYGTQFNNAFTAQWQSNVFNVNGIIERNTDIDVIRFNIPSFGHFKLNANPFNVGAGNNGSNLDLQVELMTNSNNVIRTFNPSDLLNANIDTLLNPGTYWLRLQGRGNSNTSDYASLGSYSLQGIFTPGGLLPLHKFQLGGQQVNSWHKLAWEIVADEAVVKQTVESSMNGRNFEAIGHPANEDRTFAYQPAAEGTILYRVKTEFDNGRTYYSNVIALKNGTDSRPKLQTNFSNTQLLITSPAAYEYQIVDLNGRIYERGKLSNGINQLNISGLSKGMYLVRYSSGDQVLSEKFMKH